MTKYSDVPAARHRLGKKVRVKCNEDDTIGDLKKLAAAQLGTRPEKLKIQKWYVLVIFSGYMCWSVWDHIIMSHFTLNSFLSVGIQSTRYVTSWFDFSSSCPGLTKWSRSIERRTCVQTLTDVPNINRITLHWRTMRFTMAWGWNCECKRQTEACSGVTSNDSHILCSPSPRYYQ